MWCEASDEPVVVNKSPPMKAGNSLEDKTGTIHGLVRGSRQEPKALSECEGRKFILREPEQEGAQIRTQAVRQGGALYRGRP